MRQPIPLRAPFGGLISNPAFRNVDPRNCVGCLNVHTAWGAIEKRRGYSAFSQNRNNDHSVGLRGFRLKGTDYLFSLATSSMNVINATGGGRDFDYNLPATIGDGFIAMEQYGSVVYIGGGATTRQKIYVNGTTITRAQIGIAAPTAAAVLGGHFGGSTTFPTGTYSYRYTYWNQVTGTESGPGPEATRNITGANEHNDVTPTASSDPQVTHIRLYRKLNGTDSTWFFVATLPNSATLYHDENVTIAKTLNDALNVISGLPPSQSYFMIPYKDRMFWRDDSGLSATVTDFTDLVCSEFGRPENVNANNRFRFGNASSDGVIGGIVMNRVLYVFCRNSIWAMVGDGPSSFSRDCVVPGVGLLDRDTLRFDPRTGMAFFADKMGVFAFDGSGARYVSHNVQDIYRTIDQTQPMSAGIDTRAGLYILTASFAGEPYRKQLVLDTVNGNWFVWNMDCRKLSDLRTPQNRLFLGGQAVADIALFRGLDGDTETDRGSPVSFNWQSPKIDGGTTRRKVFRYISVAYGNESSESLTLKTAIDDNPIAGAGESKSRLGKPYMKKWTVGRRADSLQFDLSGSSSVNTRVMAIDVDAEQVGHR